MFTKVESAIMIDYVAGRLEMITYKRLVVFAPLGVGALGVGDLLLLQFSQLSDMVLVR